MGTMQRTMTRMKKRKKKKSDARFLTCFRHPLSPLGHLTFVRLTIALLGLAWISGAALAPGAAGAQNSSASHVHDFVIFVTVFNDRGFALTGAQARVRRTEEKQFHWEAASDHQGELAIRVPQSAEYEMKIEARGFKTQTRKIDAQENNRTDLTIRMESATAPRTGPQTEPGTGGKP